MASHASQLVKLLAAAMAMSCLGGCMGGQVISTTLWEMQTVINSTKGYSAFQPAFFASSAFDIYMTLAGGEKVTLLIPSDRAFNAIPESIRSNSTLFNDVVLMNAFYGRVTIKEIQSAPLGNVWTSLYEGSTVTKVTASNRYGFGLQISGSQTPSEASMVAKGNLFRKALVYCHGVDYYFIPSTL